MTIEFLDEEVSEPTATTQPSTRRIVFAGEEDIQTQLNPEPEQPFFALEDAVSAIGTIPEALAVGVPAAFKRLVTGTAMPEESETIERDLAFQERMRKEQEDRRAAGKSSWIGQGIREGAPSAGYSGIGLLSAIGGGAAGLLGGPAAKVTVPAGAMAASGIASYRMAASDLLYRSFRELEKSKGSPLTDEEKAKAYEAFLPLAQESGLWEAGPEAVSNALLLGAGKFIFGFGKPVADRIVKDSLGRVTKELGKKVAAGTGALGAELAGETVTAIGQFPPEMAAQKYVRTASSGFIEPTTEGAPTEYPGGAMQAFKDVAPATTALFFGMGGAAATARLAASQFQRPKSPEQVEEDNINLDAEREADNLLIPDTDEESKSIKAQIDSERADLVVKKELYNSLPDGDKAKAVLATEIKEYEGRITELDNTLKQRLGLSVTITPVEQQQIELARGLAAEEGQQVTKTGKQIDPELTNSIGKMVGLRREGGLTLEEGFAYRSVSEGEVGSIAKEGYMITDPRLVGKEKKPRGQTTQKMFSEFNPDAPNAAYGKGDIVLRVRKENVPVGTKGQAVREGDVEVLSYDGTQWVAQTPAEFAQAREIAAPVEPAPAEVPAAPVSETITPAVEAAPVTTPAPAAAVTPDRLYLNVPFNRKEAAKSAGAKFDSERKLWYVERRPTGEMPPIAPSFIKEAEATTFLAKELEPARINAEAQLGQEIEIGSFDTPTGTAYGLKVKGGDWLNKNINLDIERQKAKTEPIAAGGGTVTATMESQPSAPGGIPEETANELYSRISKAKEDEIRKEIAEIKKGRNNPKSKWYGARDSEISKREREIGNLQLGNWGIVVDALDKELAAQRPVSEAWGDLLANLRLPNEFQARLDRAGYTKQGDLYVYQPATAPAEAAPVGIAVGNRVKTKTTPQSFVVEEALPQSEREVELGEQYYRIRNERTGEMQTVEANDIRVVRGKGMRKLFAGEKAEMPQFRRDSLDAARAMAATGKTPEEIRAVTGWFPGKYDKKMRWEIPDQKAKFKNLDNKTVWAGTGNRVNTIQGKKLSDVIDHPQLFESYPEISDLTVSIRVDPSLESRGFFDPSAKGKETKLSAQGKNKKEALSAALHEIQHWIQFKEGFSKGISLKSLETPEEAYARQMSGGGGFLQSTLDRYRNVAAEIESRDVMARMKLSDAQRKALEPYSSENIAQEEAIVSGVEPDAPVRVEEKVQPVPEADRYTFEEAGIRAIEFFGGKTPDGLVIVNDTTNPNYEMKAGYDPETGDIILNRAYIKKGESIEDILTHELGHYIFSDPKFQADFKNFLESMPDDTRAEIEAIINQSYNKDTNQTQIEERQVMAFTALVKANKDTLSKWETIKNTIKRWINKIFGTNIKLSDEGAMAVFNVGFKRFKSGERIIRAMEEGTLRTAPEGMTQMDRDYLAAVERGDMETAQKMVDEAAKKAGYDTFATHRTNARFTVFDANKINKRDSGFIGDGFYFSPGGISQSNEGYGRNAYEVYLSGKFLDLNPRTADIDKIQQAVIDQVNEKRVSKGLEKLKTTDTQYQRIVNDFKMDTAMAESGIGAIASAIKKSGYVSTIAKRMGFDGAFEKNEIVVFSPNQIKSADPVTYDDAGNVIPLSQRFRPTSPDIRRMAAEPRKPAAEEGDRARVAGLPYGRNKETPIGINRKTEEIVQKQVFNGASEVSPEKTAEAYDLIDRLLDPKTKGKYADEVNEITRSQMSENEKRQVDETIGAVKLGNELFKYAVNLAAKGDLRMLQYLFEYGNDLATSGTATISTDARNLQARANLASWVRRAAEAQKKGVVNAIAIRIFGPGVTKEQMDSIIEAVNKVNKTKTQEVDKVYDDLEDTGKAGGVDILGAVQKAMEKASLESRDPWVMVLEVLKGMEGFQKFTYEKPTQNIKSLLQGTPFAKSLANFRKKMEETGGGGLNTTFWKTLSDQENKLGPLGEVDMAINRNLGSIVKDTLIKLGLKGEPPDTKMTLIEQVANILANNDLSNAKMLQADKMISDEIDRRESGALKQAGDNQELKDIIEAEYSALRQAWDEAMSRQLDIPISDATLRRLISNRIRESKTSLNEITDIIVNDSALGNARKEGIVTSIIQQLDGLTPEGDTKKDYTKLRQALVAQFDQMIENSKLKKRMGTALRNLKKESKEDQQAERMIDKLADLQSDVQTWPKTKENKVRDIVNEDLRQKLDLSLKVANKIKPAWKGVLRQKLVDAGVNQDTAERLTEIVWRQHEINYLNRKMKEVETAVTRGSLTPIVEAIKNTPLSQQQDAKWKRKVAFDYLKNAGLDTATANRLADLMDLTLQKVFVQAQEKAFKDIVSKQAKDLNSRRGMERFLKAIRAGALDPEKNMTSELAAQNGWTGFTSEQVAKLNELDTVINDPDTLDLQRATAFKEIQDIIKTSKLDPTVKEVLSAYYTAQALNGIPTTSVNFFSAVAFSMRNAMTDAIRLAATNPAALPSAFDTFISSWKTYGSEVLFSFKNNVQRRGTVEYLSDDDALLRLYNKGKRQWKEGKRAEGFKNMLFGMMEYVGRWLKALDEGAVSVLEQQGLTRYAMEAMKQAGVSSKDARAAANYVLQQKEMFIVNSIAKGMNKTEAKALSDDVFRGAWVEALSKLKLDSQEVLDSALNDALSVIGRVNNTFDQLRQEQRNLRDNGFVSSYPIGVLERLSEAMNSPSATEGQRVFYRMVFGFAIVPARVMREAAWYSPYGGVRFALNWWAKKRGAALPYAQSLGTDLQFRQRMADTIAGSIVLGAALALGSASVDDPEDEKMFKIVVTGNGPQRKLDPQFYDTWTKKYSRNALHVFIGKTKFKINIERGFEAFAIPFMLAGARDDWKIRKRFEQSKKTPADLSDASMILGSAFLSFSRRGPFAAYMDGIASSKNSDDLLSSATSFFTFTGKTFVPIVGTSLARNISDFVSDPVDRTSMEGALWANTPVIGPMMGTKSMNALGETTGAGELSDRFYKLGMPVVFKLPNTPEQNKLRDLIIEKGQGPDIPTRYDARRTMGFELTDKQFEKYVTVYGQTMKEKMLAGYTSLKTQKPTRFVTSLQSYQEIARNRAKTAVNNMDKNP